MIRILIVEDDCPISDLIKTNLEDSGYQCTCAYDGMQAADLLETNTYDLILLDIMLPEIDGFELFEYIRPLEIPVIFLTAKAALEERVKGLSLGAEDYIVKPFEIVELLARIHVVLRRYNKTGKLLHFQEFTADPDNRTIWRDGNLLDLTPKELDLFLLFMENKNITLFREKIFESVWGGEYSEDSRTLDLHIQRLRKKTGLESRLKTIYRVGYRLEETHEIPQ